MFRHNGSDHSIRLLGLAITCTIVVSGCSSTSTSSWPESSTNPPVEEVVDQGAANSIFDRNYDVTTWQLLPGENLLSTATGQGSRSGSLDTTGAETDFAFYVVCEGDAQVRVERTYAGSEPPDSEVFTCESVVRHQTSYMGDVLTGLTYEWEGQSSQWTLALTTAPPPTFIEDQEASSGAES